MHCKNTALLMNKSQDLPLPHKHSQKTDEGPISGCRANN